MYVCAPQVVSSASIRVRFVHSGDLSRSTLPEKGKGRPGKGGDEVKERQWKAMCHVPCMPCHVLPAHRKTTYILRKVNIPSCSSPNAESASVSCRATRGDQGHFKRRGQSIGPLPEVIRPINAGG